ncbi:MAG: exosortase/archaeosortase family protein [Planctomycetota bacterium]|nr:exosortase/archaeosortase family protein [Planctomycetota bacterium]
MTTSAKPTAWLCPDWRIRLFCTICFGIAMAVLFRDLLLGCISRWTTEPQYSHGFAIPVMALGLGWFSRHKFLPGVARSDTYGLSMIVVGIVGHVAAVYFYIEAIDAMSFVITACGTTLLIWGRRAFSALWPSVLFLGFMLPLPFQIERALSGPLQILGANEAAWYIQMCGIPAIARGNIILMGDTQLGVAEACSGLRMLMVFFAISTAAVIVSMRTVWEKFLILFSTVPIALVCNIVRIVATAIAHQTLGGEMADLVFHDVSGWLMMPLAMLMLFMELKLMDSLFVVPGDSRPGLTYHGRNQPVIVQRRS